MPLSPCTSAVAGAVWLTLMFSRALFRAGLEPADVVRQAEDAVRVGPGEIGLGHQLGDPCRVGGRKAGRREHVGDEGARDGRGDRRRHHAAPTSLSGMSVQIFCLSAAEMFSAFTCRAHSSVPMS